MASVNMDPDRSVRQVKWRRSRNGARPWVRLLQLLDTTRSAVAKARAAKGRGLPGASMFDPVILLSLSGRSMGATPNDILMAMINKVALLIQGPLTHQAIGVLH